MLQLMIIAVFAVLGIGGQLPAAHRALPAWLVAALVVAGTAALCGIMSLASSRAARGLDRTGSFRAVVTLDRTILSSRWLALALHALAVFELDWLGVVRGAVGNVILLDEFIAAAPPLTVIAAGWWALAPIERRLREAGLVGRLDAGKPIYPFPSRRRYLLMQVRHSALMVLIPISLLIVVNESYERLARAAHTDFRTASPRSWSWLFSAQYEPLTHAAVQLGSIALLLLGMPIALRWLWDTVPIRGGMLERDLRALCDRANIRIGTVLLWRTQGTMVNGAVVGIVPGARSVLLTDALLDSLPGDQVRAVLAHELGHIRKRHLLWLGAIVIGTLLTLAAAASLAQTAYQSLHPSAKPPLMFAPARSEEDAEEATPYDYASSVLLLGATGLIFGWVSRRFEWQADAYAAELMSDALAAEDAAERGRALHIASSGEGAPQIAVGAGVTWPGDPQPHSLAPPPHTITRAGIAAMAGALDSVARLNHIPFERGSFRHGSIDRRISNLIPLVGVPASRAPIHRTVARTKAAAAILLTLGLSILAWDLIATLRAPPPPTPAEQFRHAMDLLNQRNRRPHAPPTAATPIPRSPAH
ncbi:hypothetical protein BH11PLA1_BH11PLA1_04670 [soil metagenome]